MSPDIARLLIDWRAAHAAMYSAVKAAYARVEASSDVDTLKFLADVCYVADRAVKYAEDARHELNALKDESAKRLCLFWLKQQTGEPVRTEHTTVTPNIKMRAKFPSRTKEPGAYAEVMKFLGVPDTLLNVPEEDRPPVDFHYIGCMDYVTRLLEEGKPLPPGIDPNSVKPVYNVRILQKKEVQFEDCEE